MKKENPSLELEGIFHKAEQEKIIKQGKRPQTGSRKSSEINEVTKSTLFSASERQTLGNLIRAKQRNPKMVNEAISIMSAAMMNNTNFVKAHFAIIENTVEAVKEKANSTDRLKRTPLFYAVYHSKALI